MAKRKPTKKSSPRHASIPHHTARLALSHLNRQGHARMVDVSGKSPTRRVAVASALVEVGATVLQLITKGRMPKGDVLAVARIAGIAAAKKTAELIPLCHPLPIESVQVELAPAPPGAVRITATAAISAKTGVEMEALTAAAVAALTLYDMCKSANKAIRIGPIQLESKKGGKSGAYHRAQNRS